MPYRLPLYLLLLFVSCTACEIDLTTLEDVADQLPGPAEPATPDASTLETVALELVNRNRATGCRCGSKRFPPVPALRLDGQLREAARTHSRDMAKMRRMQHQGSDGSRVGKRVTRTGFVWRNVGENVGWNYPDIEAMVAGWFASPGHCENMMGANFRAVGVAVEDRYYTMVLARRR